MPIVTAPANILLLGEYAVLEQGGLGVTLAVEPHVTVHLTDAPRLEIHGRWRKARSDWPGDDPGSLFSCAVAAVAEILRLPSDAIPRLPLQIVIDSSAFYDANDAKIGLGSSAVVASALCYSLISRSLPFVHASRHLRGLKSSGKTAPPLSLAFAAALAAHRTFQGGRGSGYDVAASVFGGVGRFEGGERPLFRRIHLPWLPPLLLFRGRVPVRTPDAVARFHDWKRRHPAAAGDFLEQSNRCVEAFLEARSWKEAVPRFEEARRVAIDLGERIGVPALIEPPFPVTAGECWKAVGAGNEIGILSLTTAPPETAPAHGVSLTLAPVGVKEGNDKGEEGDVGNR